MKPSDVIKEYLGDLVDDDELRAIQLSSISGRIRQLKVAVADAVYAAKAALQTDNMTSSNQFLKQAKAHKRELQYFTAEWKRLEGDKALADQPADDDEAVDIGA